MTLPVSRRDALLSALGLAAVGLHPSKASARGLSLFEEQETAPPSDATLSLADVEAVARQRLQPSALAYISGGSGDEITLQANLEAWRRQRLKPRVLVDVSNIDTRIHLLGQDMPLPILIAPTSSHKLAHPDGEIATVKGAGTAGATMVISTLSNCSVEEIGHAAKSPIWFQLYVEQDRGFTGELIQRAEAAGCRALCVTVDAPVHYARNREEKARPNMPIMQFPNLNIGNVDAASGVRLRGRNTKLNWDDIAWLRSVSKVPVLLKGVLNPDDAEHAVKAGASGVIVSNHGGRQLDTLPATMDVLAAVADRVAGRAPVLVDGGIRRGTDVLKAIALGANAVLIGRPCLYGLAVGGAQGVGHVLDILKTEFEAAMALTGRTSIKSIDRSVLYAS